MSNEIDKIANKKRTLALKVMISLCNIRGTNELWCVYKTKNINDTKNKNKYHTTNISLLTIAQGHLEIFN